MSKKLNACITYISSRKPCISLSIQSLWDNFNHKYDYPVYVHYFDDIYDDEDFREEVRSKTYYGYPNTEFEKYDYVMSLDDESMFMKDMPYDPFEVMSERVEPMGALKVYDQNKKPPHQGNFDTRINLWKFMKGYMKHYDIEPKSQFLKDLMNDPDSDSKFHYYPCADSYVVKTSLFETKEGKQWIEAVNKYGGIYKYRWGDNDVNSLFYLIHYECDMYDLKTVDDGYHSQGALRHLVDYAPGVKDNSR